MRKSRHTWENVLYMQKTFPVYVTTPHSCKFGIFGRQEILRKFFNIQKVRVGPFHYATADVGYYGAVLRRRMPHHVSIQSVCLSVRPSVRPVPPPRGKTKRPTNTKLGKKGPWDTSTPWTNFKKFELMLTRRAKAYSSSSTAP